MTGWTQEDLIAIEAAIRVALVEGVASVSVGGQSVSKYSLKDLRELREEILTELAGRRRNLGLRIRPITPHYP